MSQQQSIPQREPQAQPAATPQPVSPRLRITEDISREVYVICLPEPQRLRHPSDFRTGSLIAYKFQRYHHDPITHAFAPVFPNDIDLVLRVQHYHEKRDRNNAFPYLLDVTPKESLYLDVCKASHNDPVLHLLGPDLHMAFRYKPEEGLGYLAHAGYDWPDADEASLLPLWRTAVNLHRSSSK